MCAPFCLGDTYHLQQVYCALLAGFLSKILVDAQHFGDLISHAKNGIESGLWLLEDHRDAVAAHLHHFFFAQLQQIHAVQQNLAFKHFAW